MSKILGILGGMGPLAGANFFLAVTAHTRAACDGEHLHIVMTSRADTPDRSDFLLGKSGESPLPALKKDIERLVALGAEVIAMPCNTAHFFYDELSAFSPVPVLHMPRESLRIAADAGMKRVAILATRGTVATGLFSSLAEEYGVACLLPEDREQASLSAVIRAVKAGKTADVTSFYAIVAAMYTRGCDGILLGCTELSTLPLDGFPLQNIVVDSTLALAQSAILACGKSPCGFPALYSQACRPTYIG